MYHLAPHSTFTKVIVPADIMYHVPSYHNVTKQQETSSAAAIVCNGLEELTPDHWMEKQVELMKRITSVRTEFAATVESAAKAVEAPVEKKDKNVDKATKKAEKAKKKEDHKSHSSCTSKGFVDDANHPLVLSDQMPTSPDAGQSISACAVPSFLRLTAEKAEDSISLNVTAADAGWVKILQKVITAVKNGVKVNISVGNADFKATIGKNVFMSRISVWLYFGEILGLYSDEFHSMALFTRSWLERSEEVVTGVISKDTLMREATRFLSRWDTLCTGYAFGIVDFIVAGVLEDMKHMANNTELFVKRVLQSAS